MFGKVKKFVKSENKPEKRFDSTFAILRKLEARTRALEEEVSIIHRDVRRHDKQLYERSNRPILDEIKNIQNNEWSEYLKKVGLG